MWQVKTQISDGFGYGRTENLGKYFGVPLHHSRVSYDTYRDVLSKAKSMLSIWKTRLIVISNEQNNPHQICPNYNSKLLYR